MKKLAGSMFCKYLIIVHIGHAWGSMTVHEQRDDVQRVRTLSIQTFKARVVSCKDDKSVDFSGAHQGSDTDFLATCNNLQVPIRDSVLTKLLSEGLVNAAATVMLACVGPTHAQLEQSTASLHFAAVAQRIRMKPVMRLDPHDQVCSR
jgi:hypothetical protein